MAAQVQYQHSPTVDDLIDRRMQENAFAEGYLAASEGFGPEPTWFSPTVRNFKVDERNYDLYSALMDRFREGHSEWFD